ncbi:MAG: hypothetical protein GXN99_02600 [Candidatus Nanohaloarchaeota archaeon]|nr:hypothetical protein [Candidatus Nanohaloarchaeota archaeon]
MKKKFMLLGIVMGVVFIMPLTHSFSVKIKCKTFDQTCACEELRVLEGDYFNLKSQPSSSLYVKIHITPANKNYYYDRSYLWSHTFNRIYESSFYLYVPLNNFTREIHIEDSLGNKCGYFNISELVCSKLANYFLF